MSWQSILGHDVVLERFRRAKRRGRLAGSFLFVGPPGIGKRLFALALAKAMLCKGIDEEALDPCGVCESCRLFDAGIPELRSDADEAKRSETGGQPFVSPHPDLYYVSKPADKSFLPLESLIGDKERRGHAGLCYEISRTPYLGHRKVAVLDDADFLNAEGANALLKTLEEPPSDAVLILIGTSTTKQLPTVRSRCQIVRFAPLPARTAATLLLREGTVETLEQGLVLARNTGGSLQQARERIDDGVGEIRDELTRQLSVRSPDAVALAARLNELVDAAGKEAATRRRRLRLLLNFAIDRFREKLKKMETLDSNEQSETDRERHRNDARLAAFRMERTLDALEQVDRNAHLAYVVDAWCSDLKG